MSLYEYELYGDFSFAPTSSAEMITSTCRGAFYCYPKSINKITVINNIKMIIQRKNAKASFQIPSRINQILGRGQTTTPELWGI